MVLFSLTMGDINGWIFHKFLFHNFFLSTHSTANRAKTWTNSKLKEKITKAANQTYFDSFLKLIHVLDCEFFTFTRIWIFLYLLLILEEGRKEGGWGRQTERERERERDIDLLFHLFRIHSLILVCALTRDWTCNLGILGWCSNQQNYLTRAHIFNIHIFHQ